MNPFFERGTTTHFAACLSCPLDAASYRARCQQGTPGLGSGNNPKVPCPGCRSPPRMRPRAPGAPPLQEPCMPHPIRHTAARRLALALTLVACASGGSTRIESSYTEPSAAPLQFRRVLAVYVAHDPAVR